MNIRKSFLLANYSYLSSLPSEFLLWVVTTRSVSVRVKTGFVQYFHTTYTITSADDEYTVARLEVPVFFLHDPELLFLFIINRFEIKLILDYVTLAYIEDRPLGICQFTADALNFNINASETDVITILLDLLFNDKTVIQDLHSKFLAKQEIGQQEYVLADGLFDLFLE